MTEHNSQDSSAEDANAMLMEKLKNYVNDDEGMKRKLLVDGDGAGENRVLNNIFKHFFHWFATCENSDSQQDHETINSFMDAIQQSELSMQYSLQKIKMVARELENCESNYTNIEQAILEAKEKLFKCKDELEDAKRVRGYKVEYDLITKLIEEHPSTLTTQKQLNTLESEIADLQKINDKIDNKLEKRKKQFQLLLYASHQLKNTLEDEEDSDGFEVDLQVQAQAPGISTPSSISTIASNTLSKSHSTTVDSPLIKSDSQMEVDQINGV